MSNKECEIVQDLLPLYYDKACSEASCSFVEKHMAGCSDCQKIYNELQENNVDEVLAKPGFAFCEIFTDTIQVWEPKSSARRLGDETIVRPQLEDLAPFLPREDLRENLYIKPLDDE